MTFELVLYRVKTKLAKYMGSKVISLESHSHNTHTCMYIPERAFYVDH